MTPFLVLYRRAMRLHRRALLGWAIGVTLACVVTLVTYPTVRESAEDFERAIQALPQAMKAFLGDLSDIATGAGFVRGRLFAILFPVIFVAYGISRGGDAIAGEEERGRLDLLLAHPIPRSRFLLAKAAALATGVLVLSLVALALLLAGGAAYGMGLDAGRVGLTIALLALHTLAAAAIALAAGAATGRKSLATGAAASVAAAGYVFEGLGNLTPSLAFLHKLSLFHAYGGGATLTRDVPAGGAVALAAIALALLGVAWATLERRDVGVA